MLREKNTVILTVVVSLIFANSIVAQSSIEHTSIYRLAAGTRIPVRLDVELSSRNATRSDTFISRTTAPVLINDVVALPEGTIIEGEVLAVKPAAFGGRDGEIDLDFRSIKFGVEAERRLWSAPIKRIGESRSAFISVAAIGGSAAGGYAIGSATGDGDGKWFGAGVGAAIGAGISLFRKGRDASIRSDQLIYVVVEKDVILPVLDN